MEICNYWLCYWPIYLTNRQFQNASSSQNSQRHARTQFKNVSKPEKQYQRFLLYIQRFFYWLTKPCGLPLVYRTFQDQLIRAQQETIYQQQQMIVKQQTEFGVDVLQSNRNAPSQKRNPNGGGAYASSSSSSSVKTIDNFKQTGKSNDGDDNNGRLSWYGEFKCPGCNVLWKSDNARMGVGRECKRCHISVYPTNMVSLFIDYASQMNAEITIPN